MQTYGEVTVPGNPESMTGDKLRKALARLDLSQAEAARRMHVSTQAVQYWVTGQRKIPGPVVALLECWETKRLLRDTLEERPAPASKKRM